MTDGLMGSNELLLRADLRHPFLHADALARQQETESEIVWEDNRHGLGDRGWITVRIRLRSGLFRRFYAHRAGFLIEGGRGGARIFDCRDAPHPYHALSIPFARTRNLQIASWIVEALSTNPRGEVC